MKQFTDSDKFMLTFCLSFDDNQQQQPILPLSGLSSRSEFVLTASLMNRKRRLEEVLGQLGSATTESDSRSLGLAVSRVQECLRYQSQMVKSAVR